MLHEFLTANRADLIERCRLKVSRRPSPPPTASELEHGIPLFLDQLIMTLQLEGESEPLQSLEVSGPADGNRARSDIATTASEHGADLMRRGFQVDQVVHDYGDLCQAITDLAFEGKVVINVDEFRTLNRCLDNGIAGAVTEFSQQHDRAISDKRDDALNERLGSLAHELRNLINNATLAVAAIRKGNVGLGGATGAVLDRSLVSLRNLVDRSIADVRVTAGMPANREVVSVADFIAEVRILAALEAHSKQCTFIATEVDPTLSVAVDRDMLFSAVGNLLQNAFKFTRRGTCVSLSAHSVGDRVHIDVADHCGGLPKNGEETMFAPFVQGSGDRSGLGLGLMICRRSMRANGGNVRARDIPGSGCIFTIDLPRH